MLVCSIEGLGSRVQVAHPKAHLAHEVLGEPDAVHEPVALQLVAGLAGVLLGLGPAAVQHLELRLMDAADARVPADTLAAHPALTLLGPLGGALQVADVAARADRDALDVARDTEVESARCGGRGRLIQLGEAFPPLPQHDVCHALKAHAHVERVGVVAVAAELDRAVGVLESVLDPALHQRADGLVDLDVGMQLRVRPVAEQALSARRPPLADSVGEAAVGLVAERERHAGGLLRRARLLETGERPLERVGRLVRLPGPPGRGAQELEITCWKIALAIGIAEAVDRRASSRGAGTRPWQSSSGADPVSPMAIETVRSSAAWPVGCDDGGPGREILDRRASAGATPLHSLAGSRHAQARTPTGRRPR